MLRNTLYLYVRMTVAAVTGFVTVRIATGVLGVVDYGVFSAVAAAVGLLQVLNGAVTLTAQRNLCRAVGLGDADALAREFSAVAALFALLSALMLAVGWGGMSGWIATGMDIPPDRLDAARHVLCVGAAVMAVRTLQIPFTALIMAHERMAVFAAIGVVEMLLSLALVGLMRFAGAFALQFYAWTFLVVSAAVLAWEVAYCRSRFPAVRLRRFAARDVRGLLSFTGWSALPSIANGLRYQGLALLLNAFCGVRFNASWMVSAKFGNGLYQPMGNMQQAYNPRIVKLWTAGDREGFFALLASATRCSYLVTLLLAFPAILWAREFLGLWIGGELPPQIVEFVRWTAVYFLVDALTQPQWTAIVATGEVAGYMVTVSAIYASSIVFAWGALRLGWPPWTVPAANAAVNAASFLYRVAYLRLKMGMDLAVYFRRGLLLPILVTAVLALLAEVRALLP